MPWPPSQACPFFGLCQDPPGLIPSPDLPGNPLQIQLAEILLQADPRHLHGAPIGQRHTLRSERTQGDRLGGDRSRRGPQDDQREPGQFIAGKVGVGLVAARGKPQLRVQHQYGGLDPGEFLVIVRHHRFQLGKLAVDPEARAAEFG